MTGSSTGVFSLVRSCIHTWRKAFLTCASKVTSLHTDGNVPDVCSAGGWLQLGRVVSLALARSEKSSATAKATEARKSIRQDTGSEGFTEISLKGPSGVDHVFTSHCCLKRAGKRSLTVQKVYCLRSWIAEMFTIASLRRKMFIRVAGCRFRRARGSRLR